MYISVTTRNDLTGVRYRATNMAFKGLQMIINHVHAVNRVYKFKLLIVNYSATNKKWKDVTDVLTRY